MKIIGHRGARGLAPENTIAGFQKALEYHVDEIEFDVRVTKDNVPVLLHDAHASDAAGNTLTVRDSPYDELKAHKPDLTTLREALDFIDTRVALLIEVKPHEPTEPIVLVIREYVANGMYRPGDLALGSFSQKTLVALHKALPDIPTVVIERWSGVKATIRAKQVGAVRMNMKQLWLWNGFLGPMKKRGWQIAPYTMNDPAKVRKWHKNLYGVITDYPDRFEK